MSVIGSIAECGGDWSKDVYFTYDSAANVWATPAVTLAADTEFLVRMKDDWGMKFGDSCPYIEDKIYYLADGTPFYFTKDYITIGFNTYYFYEFANPLFIKGLTKDFKKTIATIYINGLKITIKK